jgi:hypothetical protein
MIRLKQLLTEQDLKPYIKSTNWLGFITWNYPAIEKCNNPADIAAILKKAHGILQDDEAAAEAAFIGITNRSPIAAVDFYLRVNAALGNYTDAYSYVQDYMDTSIKYHKRSIDDSAKIIQTAIGAEDPKEVNITSNDIRELPPVVINLFGVQKAREIKRNVVRAFNAAINWWITYLSLPRTQANFNINWSKSMYTQQVPISRWQSNKITIGSAYASSVFPAYIKQLKRIKLRTYYSPYARHAAYVDPRQLDYVNVNLIPKEFNALKMTIVHELQHTLFEIHPLNPGDKYETVGLQEPVQDAIKKIDDRLTYSVLTQLQKLPGLKTVTMEDLSYLALETTMVTTSKPEYTCEDTEQGSRLEAIRSDLNRTQIVPKDFLPAFKGVNNVHSNYVYILYCWILKGYPDFQQYITNLNTMVKNDDKEKPETIKLKSLAKPDYT